jgi:uncharacterized membrane protein
MERLGGCHRPRPSASSAFGWALIAGGAARILWDDARGRAAGPRTATQAGGTTMSEGPGAAAPAATPPVSEPIVRTIKGADVTEALAAGLRDFQAAPLYGLFFGGIYALGGMLIVAAIWRWDMIYLAYPLAAGFALIGPFVAVGLYEVSRLRERHEALSWSKVLGVVFAQGGRELGWMSLVCVFIFMMWMYQVRLLLALFFGFEPVSADTFLRTLFGTPEGWLFLAIGHADGAVLSVILFSLTVVSFPLLLEREVDFITAMITSVRAVTRNPVPMLVWALVIVILMIAACLPLFMGLFVVLPVLGHATWHLYRRIVAPAPGDPRPAETATA